MFPDELTPSAAGSRVRTSRLLVKNEELWATTARYGSSTPVSFATFDHDGSSWRTHQLSLGGEFIEFSETWPRSGTIRNGIAYPLPHLERPTVGIGHGLLPTPTTKANQMAPSMMKHAGCRRLAEIMLPTPNSGSDHWGGSWRECGGSGNPLRGTPLGIMKIHPLEWEWMMGFPSGWTDLAR